MALGFMRRHRWWLNWFLVLIIAAFILLYVPAFLKTDTGAPGEVLADVGGLSITRGEFDKTLRERMGAEQLEALVTDGVSVTPAEAEQEFRRRNEQVKLEYVLADASKFREGQSVSDDEVKARFDSAKETYRLPERRIL